jgi:hypothetical protein
MGSEYVWGQNPIQDTLLQMITLGVDIADDQFKKELNTIFTLIIENHVNDKEDLVYLDFKIKKLGIGGFKLIGNNIVSALWLSGMIPKNPTAVMDANECHIGGMVYTFDKKKKVLTRTIKK